jgi:acetyl-CoA carboxylase alpha subunit
METTNENNKPVPEEMPEPISDEGLRHMRKVYKWPAMTREQAQQEMKAAYQEMNRLRKEKEEQIEMTDEDLEDMRMVFRQRTMTREQAIQYVKAAMDDAKQLIEEERLAKQ